LRGPSAPTTGASSPGQPSSACATRTPCAVTSHCAERSICSRPGQAPSSWDFTWDLRNPAQSYLALRALGHRLTWVGGRGASPGWSPAIRERYQRDHGDLLLPDIPYAWERRLYKARQILNAGRSVFISADGAGAVAFSVPLPGGPAAIGTGWLLLRQTTKAAVLPVLSHLEGRTQVVTVLPPLPPRLADPDRDREACRRAIAEVMGDYVCRFPEQCYSLVFGLPPEEPAPARKPIRR
jgi:hypothetical protein